jgi:isopenicillin-N N-acyltransferase-like protein
MSKIRLLEVCGTSFDMGYQHGLAYLQEIHELAEERIHLSSDKNWTGQALSRQEVLALGQACLPDHEAYAPDLIEELHGLSQATGVGLAELVILNGFTDFIDTVYNVDPALQAATQISVGAGPVPAHPGADNCTAFIVSPDAAAEGQGFYGQTWDMHDSATPYVILLRGKPAGGLSFLTLTIIGCVGMIGMNEAGIAVGVNNLMASDGQVGVTWPFVIRKVLAQDNLADALASITGAPLAGGHNYMLVDAQGRGYNVEAMGSRYHVEAVTRGSVVHTNHCLITQNVAVERPRLPKSRASSEQRLTQAQELLANGSITLTDLFDLTRQHGDTFGICAHATAPFWVESCGAAIMRPATQEMWAVWGNPCQNEYQKFTV